MKKFFNIGANHPYDNSPSVILSGDEKREWNDDDARAEAEGNSIIFFIRLKSIGARGEQGLSMRNLNPK